MRPSLALRGVPGDRAVSTRVHLPLTTMLSRPQILLQALCSNAHLPYVLEWARSPSLLPFPSIVPSRSSSSRRRSLPLVRVPGGVSALRKKMTKAKKTLPWTRRVPCLLLKARQGGPSAPCHTGPSPSRSRCPVQQYPRHPRRPRPPHPRSSLMHLLAATTLFDLPNRRKQGLRRLLEWFPCDHLRLPRHAALLTARTCRPRRPTKMNLV